MCAEYCEFAMFLSINSFDITHTSRVGEFLLGPVYMWVNGSQHFRLDGCTELNVSYNLWSLILVNELGIRDVLCLRPLHSRFTLVVRPVKNRRPYLWVFTHVWVMNCNREIMDFKFF